jgi:hypothetical protein
MGWTGWTQNDNGSVSNEKVTEYSDGSSKTEYLNTTGGSKENHTHVIITEKSDGTKSAHCVPHKNNR